MNLIVDFTTRTVQATARQRPYVFDDQLQIAEWNEVTVIFQGFSKLLSKNISGSMDRMIGDGGTVATSTTQTIDYSLKCLHDHLTMRPTGLGHGFYKNDVDYGVYCGEWCIASTKPALVPPLVLGVSRSQQTATMRTSNQVATLNEAKAEFEASWKQWKAWAEMEEV